MLKRVLNSFADHVAMASGTVVGARGGNDVYSWVKSGEAKKAVSRFINGTETPADATANAHAKVAEGQPAARKDTPPVGARVSAGSTTAQPRSHAREEASELEQLSEDDVAALRTRRNVSSESVVVCCTYCNGRQHVARATELTQCTDCGKRFWIELG